MAERDEPNVACVGDDLRDLPHGPIAFRQTVEQRFEFHFRPEETPEDVEASEVEMAVGADGETAEVEGVLRRSKPFPAGAVVDEHAGAIRKIPDAGGIRGAPECARRAAKIPGEKILDDGMAQLGLRGRVRRCGVRSVHRRRRGEHE